MAIATAVALGAACDPPVKAPPAANPSRAPIAPGRSAPTTPEPIDAAAPVSPGAASAPASASASAQPEQSKLAVHLVPIGKVPQEMIDETVKGLREHAPVEPIVEQAQDFPAQARSSEPGRYKAIELLTWLDRLPLSKGGKVMGITESDIVTPKGGVRNWGILGMGSLDGRCSVISTWRMKRKWENGGAPDWLVRERLWKVALHELGHTLGLEHCPQVGCIMEDGHGTVKTTDRDKEMCASCAKRFAQALERERDNDAK